MTVEIEVTPSGKVLAIDALADVCARLRGEGKTIAHCHGAFDLLHPGHIRHLQAARRKADVLVVTVTQDRFIRKGPGRPVYDEQVRAESLAALAVVDYVATSPWPTGVETIERLRPDFYVKGQDYRERASGSTGPIVEEKRAVERCGGRLVFTDEIQLSSTALLEEHFAAVAPQREEYLAALWERYSVDDVMSALDRVANTRVLVVGEAVVEEHHRCSAVGPGDEPCGVSVRVESTHSCLSGAFALAHRLSGLVGSVTLLLGGGVSDELDAVSRPTDGVDVHEFALFEGPTPRRRYYADAVSGRLLFETTSGGAYVSKPGVETVLREAVEQFAPAVDLTIVVGSRTVALVSKRTIAPRTFGDVLERELGDSVVWGVGGSNQISKGAHCICLDERTLRRSYDDLYGPLRELIMRLSEQARCHRLCIRPTTGGAIYYDGESCYHAPPLSPHDIGSTRCHASAAGVVAPLAHVGAPPELIPFITSCARALHARAACRYEPISPETLRSFVMGMLRR